MKFSVTTHRDMEAVRAYLDRLPEGKRYDVTVTLHREKRSVSQNALYWLWLTCMESETGHDTDDLHDYFCQRYLGQLRHTLFAGTEYSMDVYRIPSTRSL